jgi:hypothetical protein
MRAEVVFLGSDLGPAHISRLKDYLEITSKALAEDRATDGVTNRAAIE